MKLLLDTHIAIWALNDDPSLSAKARELILNPDNAIYYSAVSVWEVLLKHARHPENIPFDEVDFSEGCREAGFIPLRLSERHILTVRTLSRPRKEHNDPFDRLLLAHGLISGYAEDCILPV